ncbi:hypothetical protein KR222_002632, partial [Zaprionus bogoriensis]
KACHAKPGHSVFIKNRTVIPVVVSAKRYNSIMYNSLMMRKRDQLQAEEDERQYNEYLQKGSDALCSLFTNMGGLTLEEERQLKLQELIEEDKVRREEVWKEDDQKRKERIIRAYRLLENLKPGQRALHQAVLASDVAYQRKYDGEVKREIAEEEHRHQEQQDLTCPEVLIPFCSVTEEQEKAKQLEQALTARKALEQDIEERRARRLADEAQQQSDAIRERAECQRLHELEKKAARDKVKARRQFCQRALQESRQDKAESAKFESIREQMEDRKICVYNAHHRQQDKRSSEVLKEKRAKIIREREARGIQVCRAGEQKKHEESRQNHQCEDHFRNKQEADEYRRNIEQQILRKKRIAYQLDERKQLEERRQRDAQLRRFDMALRFKNTAINSSFNLKRERELEKEKEDWRKVVMAQREDYLARREAEMLFKSSFDDDPYMREDVWFFRDAVKAMVNARKSGRPVYNIARAVQEYRQKNKIDFEPERRMVRRSQLRDYCWPGYYSKAQQAYKKYEQREEFRQQQENKRHNIFSNCIKITKMGAEESPYKPCPGGYTIKCCQHRGLPVGDCDSFADVG